MLPGTCYFSYSRRSCVEHFRSSRECLFCKYSLPTVVGRPISPDIIRHGFRPNDSPRPGSQIVLRHTSLEHRVSVNKFVENVDAGELKMDFRVPGEDYISGATDDRFLRRGARDPFSGPPRSTDLKNAPRSNYVTGFSKSYKAKYVQIRDSFRSFTDSSSDGVVSLNTVYGCKQTTVVVTQCVGKRWATLRNTTGPSGVWAAGGRSMNFRVRTFTCTPRRTRRTVGEYDVIISGDTSDVSSFLCTNNNVGKPTRVACDDRETGYVRWDRSTRRE